MIDPIFVCIVISACSAGAATYFSKQGHAGFTAVTTGAAVGNALIAIVKTIQTLH